MVARRESNGNEERCPVCGSATIHGVARPIAISEVVKAVASCYGIDEAALLSGQLARLYSMPRQIAMWLSWHLVPGMTIARIASHFCRNHKTVIYARYKIDSLADTGILDRPAAFWLRIHPHDPHSYGRNNTPNHPLVLVD